MDTVSTWLSILRHLLLESSQVVRKPKCTKKLPQQHQQPDLSVSKPLDDSSMQLLTHPTWGPRQKSCPPVLWIPNPQKPGRDIKQQSLFYATKFRDKLLRSNRWLKQESLQTLGLLVLKQSLKASKASSTEGQSQLCLTTAPVTSLSTCMRITLLGDIAPKKLISSEQF